MSKLDYLFENNKKWADQKTGEQPDFFAKHAEGQQPEILWIGCSDSRVPVNEITGLDVGEVFVHRNIANLVIHSDINSQSVIQYAVEALKVKHIVICGHYGCGGVKASMQHEKMGLIDNWLRQIKELYQNNEAELKQMDDEQKKFDRLCELNVHSQVHNVCHTSFVQDAWAKGQELWVHGFIYDLHDGRIKDLGLTVGLDEAHDEIFAVS